MRRIVPQQQRSTAPQYTSYRNWLANIKGKSPDIAGGVRPEICSHTYRLKDAGTDPRTLFATDPC